MKKLIVIILLLWVCVNACAQFLPTTRGFLKAGTFTQPDPPPNPTGGVMIVQVTFSGTPSANTTVESADLKYNKYGVFSMDWDDRAGSAVDAAAYMSGGTTRGGVTYQGKTFTDGCGNPIKYTAGVATNAVSGSSDWSALGGTMNWTQMKSVLDKDWGFLNHGYTHGSIGVYVTNGWNQTDNLFENVKYIYDQFKLQGREYVMRTTVVPSNDTLYNAAAEQIGDLASTSEGTFGAYQSVPYPNYLNNGVADITDFKNDWGHKAFSRKFRDVDDATDVTAYTTDLAVLIAQSTSSAKKIRRAGVHTTDLTYFPQIIDYLYNNSQDKIWVTSLHEMMEYFETCRRTDISTSISGNTMTITLDQRYIPEPNRWRDLSLLISGAGVSISSVSVSGADDFSYNATTGLVNVFKKKTSGFVDPDTYVPFQKNVEIPITAQYVYGENTIENVDKWFDGRTNETFDENFIPSLSAFYTPFEVYIKLPETWSVRLTKIRMYDYNGTSSPATEIYGIRKDNLQREYLGSYTGSAFGAWYEINIRDTMDCVYDRLVFRGISGNGTGAHYGSELELIGSYRAAAKPTEFYVTKEQPTLEGAFAVNGFIWDWTDHPVNQVINRTDTVWQPKVNRIVEVGASIARFYFSTFYVHDSSSIDGFKWTPDATGHYLDTALRYAKLNGVEPLLTLQANPTEIYSDYVGSEDLAKDYSPVLSADNNYDGKLDPESYSIYSKLAFRAAARYGRNTNISPSLMGVPYQSTVWYVPSNTIQIGLDYVRYLEIGNEWDKFWKGVNAYMSGRQFGAMLSAIYDGHKGTMGEGYGIKNADSTMLVTTGLARASVDAWRGMYDWCKENRGYKPNGAVDLPFDIINYHSYANNAESQYSGNYTTGMPVELSAQMRPAREFIDYTNHFAEGKPVWITEWGYDWNQGSPLKAQSYNGHAVNDVIGAWAVRHMLVMNSIGIDAQFWYKMYQEGDSSATQFSTMRMFHDEFVETGGLQYPHPPGVNYEPTYERTPLGDYWMQFKKYKDYVFDSYVDTSRTKWVLKYTRPSDGAVMYALWGLESYVVDGSNNVTFTESTGTHNLSLPTGATIAINTLTTGSETFTTTMAVVSGGSHPITYGYKPVFVEIVSGDVGMNAITSTDLATYKHSFK
jgi:hypothetical protein